VTTDFYSAGADFVAFAVAQGYPPVLLWTTLHEVLVWRRRFYVRWGDSPAHERKAKEAFEAGIEKGLGVELEAKCKTDHVTICRVLVPADEIDAQYRMIPKAGVKMSVPVHSPSAVLVRSTVVWWLLKLVGSRSLAALD